LALTTPASDAAIKLAYLAGVDLPTGVDDDLALAESLFVPLAWLRDLFWLLEDKKGLVLYGPLGTGKTILAQQIAKRLQPDPERRSLVQLHPSYGYEEFFEGYRPTSEKDETREEDKGAIRLRKQPGRLKLLMKKITGSSEVGVLVLDEMIGRIW
jgi:5-methylcytosine-specific restriction protein B